MAPFELATFNGDWKDSSGNAVTVWEGTRGTQVKLTSSSGKEVLLAVTKSRDNLYECGHYEFVDNRSSSSRIVWRDKRFRDRVTVWTRAGANIEERRDSYRDQSQQASQPRHRSEEWRETRQDEPRHDRLDARRDGRDRSPLRRKRALPMPLTTPSPQKSQGSSGREPPGHQGHPPHEVNGATPAVGSHGPPPGQHGTSPPPAGWHGAAPPPSASSSPHRAVGQYPADGLVWSHPPAHASWPPPERPPHSWGQPLPGTADPRLHSHPPAGQLGGGSAALPFPPPMPGLPAGPHVGLAHAPPPGHFPSQAPGLPLHTPQLQPMPLAARFPEQVRSPASSSISWPAGSAQASATAKPAIGIAPGLEQAPKSPLSDDTAPPSPNPIEPAAATRSGSAGARPPAASLIPEKAGWSEVLELLAASNHPAEEKAVSSQVPPSPLEPSEPAPLLGPLPVPSFPPPPPPPPPPAPLAPAGAQPFGYPQQPPAPQQPPGQIAELFSPFGLPQVAPAQAQISEEERGHVLEEILARLRKVVGAGIATAPWRQSSAAEEAARVPAPQAPAVGTDRIAETSQVSLTEPSLGEKLLHGDDEEEGIPDWRRGASTAGSTDGTELAPKKHVGARVVPPEGPLEKFIRVFRLDELAAKCLRALQDDEVAFVIENCQGRLAHAKNPSAVVMTSIKGVANRVGRRYWGNREASDLEALLAAAGMGSGASRKRPDELQFFLGSPEPEVESEAEEAEEVNETSGADADPYGGVAAADPYGGMVVEEEEEEEEEEKAVDEVVDPNDADMAVVNADPEAKRRRIEAPAVVELDLDDDDEKPVEEVATAGVAECEVDAEDVSDGEEDGLFFVDTGGV